MRTTNNPNDSEGEQKKRTVFMKQEKHVDNIRNSFIIYTSTHSALYLYINDTILSLHLASGYLFMLSLVFIFDLQKKKSTKRIIHIKYILLCVLYQGYIKENDYHRAT